MMCARFIFFGLTWFLQVLSKDHQLHVFQDWSFAFSETSVHLRPVGKEGAPEPPTRLQRSTFWLTNDLVGLSLAHY